VIWICFTMKEPKKHEIESNVNIFVITYLLIKHIPLNVKDLYKSQDQLNVQVIFVATINTLDM